HFTPIFTLPSPSPPHSHSRLLSPQFSFFFFFNDTTTTEIYTLSLHDALPICIPAILCKYPPDSKPVCDTGAPASRSWSRRPALPDRKSTRLNSSHVSISYAVFCLKKKKDKSRPEYKRTSNYWRWNDVKRTSAK